MVSQGADLMTSPPSTSPLCDCYIATTALEANIVELKNIIIIIIITYILYEVLARIHHFNHYYIIACFVALR